MKKVRFWVVSDDSLVLSYDKETRVLWRWCGNGVQLFPSYDKARSAVRSTNRYEKKHGFGWTKNFGPLTIRGLREV